MIWLGIVPYCIRQRLQQSLPASAPSSKSVSFVQPNIWAEQTSMTSLKVGIRLRPEAAAQMQTQLPHHDPGMLGSVYLSGHFRDEEKHK